MLTLYQLASEFVRSHRVIVAIVFSTLATLTIAGPFLMRVI